MKHYIILKRRRQAQKFLQPQKSLLYRLHRLVFQIFLTVFFEAMQGPRRFTRPTCTIRLAHPERLIIPAVLTHLVHRVRLERLRPRSPDLRRHPRGTRTSTTPQASIHARGTTALQSPSQDPKAEKARNQRPEKARAPNTAQARALQSTDLHTRFRRRYYLFRLSRRTRCALPPRLPITSSSRALRTNRRMAKQNRTSRPKAQQKARAAGRPRRMGRWTRLPSSN